jgi:hypothetical protein
LCKVREGLEKVKVKYEEAKKMSVLSWRGEGEEFEIPFSKWEKGVWDDDNYKKLVFEKKTEDMPVGWGAEPDWGVRSFADVTFVGNEEMAEAEKEDVYNTKEVLKVLDQWIEYLVKFYEEQKDLSE